MKAKFFALLISCSLLGSMTAPLFAQDSNSANPAVDEITVPEGTEFKLQLHTTINSSTSKAGDRIMCSLIDPVAVEDRDVLPKGVRIDGHVGESRPAGRKGKGGLSHHRFRHRGTAQWPKGGNPGFIDRSVLQRKRQRP